MMHLALKNNSHNNGKSVAECLGCMAQTLDLLISKVVLSHKNINVQICHRNSSTSTTQQSMKKHM